MTDERLSCDIQPKRSPDCHWVYDEDDACGADVVTLEGRRSHKVEDGETLWSIGEKYQQDFRRLCEINPQLRGLAPVENPDDDSFIYDPALSPMVRTWLETFRDPEKSTTQRVGSLSKLLEKYAGTERFRWSVADREAITDVTRQVLFVGDEAVSKKVVFAAELAKVDLVRGGTKPQADMIHLVTDWFRFVSESPSIGDSSLTNIIERYDRFFPQPEDYDTSGVAWVGPGYHCDWCPAEEVRAAVNELVGFYLDILDESDVPVLRAAVSKSMIRLTPYMSAEELQQVADRLDGESNKLVTRNLFWALSRGTKSPDWTFNSDKPNWMALRETVSEYASQFLADSDPGMRRAAAKALGTLSYDNPEIRARVDAVFLAETSVKDAKVNQSGIVPGQTKVNYMPDQGFLRSLASYYGSVADSADVLVLERLEHLKWSYQTMSDHRDAITADNDIGDVRKFHGTATWLSYSLSEIQRRSADRET